MNDTKFKNIKEWSNSFNELQNWMNLNALLAMMSNLETYMATVIPLAIESDIDCSVRCFKENRWY